MQPAPLMCSGLLVAVSDVEYVAGKVAIQKQVEAATQYAVRVKMQRGSTEVNTSTNAEDRHEH